MAIAFRAAGSAVTKDISTGNTIAVPTPAGFAAGDYLLAFLLQDSNTNSTPPGGWTLVGRCNAGSSNFTWAAPRLEIYGKIASGSEGASVSWTYNTAAWPIGSPFVVAFMLSYTGTDTVTPVEVFSQSSVSGSGGIAVEPHPQVTTATANDWLLTVRTAADYFNTFTCTDSVGTDLQRQIATGFSELTLVAFDSNAALAAGLQTQRSTTLSGNPTSGTGMVTLALKPAPGAGSTTAIAQTATVAAAALGATATVVAGSWSAICGISQLPVYTWAVDWALSGLTAMGLNITGNATAYLDSGDLTGWAASNCTQTYAKTALGLRTLPTNHVVPNGVSASGGVSTTPHSAVGSVTPGNSYIADCWVYSPGGWADLRACIDWYDSSDAFLSTSLGSATSVPAGVWTHLRQTLTAPASASRADAFARFGSTPAGSNDFYVWGLMVMDPTLSDARMMPDATAVIQADILDAGVTFGYGRDQHRQLTPAALGTASFTLTNKDRVYSPDYTGSPLSGSLDAARPVRGQCVYNGTAYGLFSGYLNDYNVVASRTDRSVQFSAQDRMSLAQATKVSTALYPSIRTGAAIGVILDAIGWTGPRDIDPGATVIPFWWLEQATVPSAINDLVLSEGPPAIAYTAPDGTFVFRDRSHRLVRGQSTTQQASFGVTRLGDCTAPAVTGLTLTDPFTYSHGWRDIVNSVTFSVPQRRMNGVPTVVWNTTSTLSLAIGQSVTVTASASDPFMNAITPVQGTDFTAAGVGVVQVSLNKNSGQSAQITLLAVGGSVTVSGLQLRAYSMPLSQTLTVIQKDAVSITQHGEQSYPNNAPWAGVEDALAIAETILLRYAQRRPVVQITVANQDPTHFLHVLQRTISDLVHIEHDEMGINADFFVEYVQHAISRMNASGQPPVHTMTLYCEQKPATASNTAFTFDVRGAGFDNGVFDPIVGDLPTTVWKWDDPIQGAFNQGVFGT